MCLAVPMRVCEVRGPVACCRARGEERSAGLLMLAEQVSVGDWVLVHLGQAVARVTEDEARQAWRLFDEILGPPAG